jgi:hypothetical protein
MRKKLVLVEEAIEVERQHTEKQAQLAISREKIIENYVEELENLDKVFSLNP